jgi:peptidoglycan/LPS O-acetylase OafA/YrhL
MRYKALDSWRGICAVLVVLFHAEGNGPFGSSAFVRGAFLFVDFFFVLSGFVISAAYTTRIASREQFREFLLRRLGRVWPLHVAVLGALLALELAKVAAISAAGVQFNSPPFSGTLSLHGLLPSLLMVHAMGLLPALTWNVPSWSIGAEFWTYIVFALLVWWRRAHRIPLAVLIAAAAAALVIARSHTYMDVTYDLGFARCLYGFFTGVVVHRLISARAAQTSTPGTVSEIVAVAGAVLFVAMAHDGHWAFASPLVFAGVIWVFALSTGALSTLLHTAPLQAVGTWSYSIYMIHLFILGTIHTLTRLVGPRLTGSALDRGWSRVAGLPGVEDGRIVAFALLVIGVSALTYRWIEVPGQRWFNRLALSARHR